MPLSHLDCTPASLHRVNTPLLWEPRDGRTPDGQVVWRNVNGVMTRFLLPQPRKPKKYEGVSFFLPQCDQRILDASHEDLGKGVFTCVLPAVGTPLPEGLRMVNDKDFTLRLVGSTDRTFVGQHYTLFAECEMPTDDFEREYNQLLKTCLPCSMQASGATAPFTSLIDPYVLPADRCSAVAVQALEALAAKTTDPNTAMFATLFAGDMRACDTDFEDVLTGCGNRTLLVAAALDQFVARDPMVREYVLDAQEALAAELPAYKPQGCKYEPFWVSVQ